MFGVALLFAVGVFRQSPHDAYNRGFKQWVSEHVATGQIRTWLAAQSNANTDKPAPFPWPNEIARISPVSVIILKDNRAVLLQWGAFGSWGNARRVVVMRDPGDAPWVDPNGHFPNDPLDEGLYGGRQWNN